jgi:malonyl-CoA/methylmalonyl-CoA synthetase
VKELKTYKIVGRTSVDVIKSGGYKISALDIEKELLAHPSVEDVCVIGLSDATWGQLVCSLLVLKPSSSSSSSSSDAATRVREFDENEFVEWCKQRLPKYSVPRRIKLLDKLPRNQLGKVNKKELVKIYEAEQDEN